MSKIHKATVQDIQQIQRIAVTTWPVAFEGILSQHQLDYMMRMMYNTQELTFQIESGEIIFWIAEIKNTFLGFMAMSPICQLNPRLKSINYIFFRLHKVKV